MAMEPDYRPVVMMMVVAMAMDRMQMQRVEVMSMMMV